MNDETNNLNLNLHKRHKSNNFFQRSKGLILICVVIIILGFVWSSISSTSSVFNFSIPGGNPLKSTDDRVNVLLLGNGGGKHDGPYLTDTIIIASYHLKSKKTTLISVPRDLWLPSVSAKVNTIYVYGQKSGDPLSYSGDKIDDILGIPIHYAVRLDFSGFVKAVDLVGGIDVDIPKTFDDFNYPIEGKESDLCGLSEKEMEFTQEQIDALNLKGGHIVLKPGKNKVLVDSTDKIATDSGDFACRFEHVHFEKGSAHMNGTLALKFVRSRMGTNGEGSDFARSRRQQIVIEAFRGKLLSLETLANPLKVKDLISTFGESFETNIPIERSLDFYKLIKNSEHVSSIVLGDLGGGKSILSVPPPSDYGGAFVLIPPNNDFTPIKDYIKQRLDEDSIASDSATTK